MTKYSARAQQRWVLLSLTQQLPQYIFHIGKHFAGWLMCCDSHTYTHTHTHYLCLLYIHMDANWFVPTFWPAFKSHFLLEIRWVHLWGGRASTANGPEISESREPSSLISLTGIKPSLIYDPRVCVINSNEWRQDATGAFLWANITPLSSLI